MTGELPILFVPGVSCNRGLWEHQLKFFENYTETWVAPLPEYDDLGRIAEAILADAPERFAAVGLSMGGYLCFEMYKRAPERIEKMALMSTSVVADLPVQARRRRMLINKVRTNGYLTMWREAIKRMVHPDHLNDEKFLNTLVRQTFEGGIEGFCNHQMAMMRRPCYADVARSITCPTTIIAGGGDVPTPVSAHKEIADLIPGSNFYVLNKAGHLPPLEAPDDVNGILWQWYFEGEWAIAAE